MVRAVPALVRGKRPGEHLNGLSLRDTHPPSVAPLFISTGAASTHSWLLYSQPTGLVPGSAFPKDRPAWGYNTPERNKATHKYCQALLKGKEGGKKPDYTSNVTVTHKADKTLQILMRHSKVFRVYTPFDLRKSMDGRGSLHCTRKSSLIDDYTLWSKTNTQNVRAMDTSKTDAHSDQKIRILKSFNLDLTTTLSLV